MLDQDTSTRRYVQRFLKQRKVFVHPEFELATSDMIVQFALRNLGVGSVVRDFAKKELDSRELIAVSYTHLDGKTIAAIMSYKAKYEK